MTFSEYFSPDNLRKNKKILIWIILIIVLLIIVIIGIVLWLKFRPKEAIVFGTEAEDGEFPHHVLVGIRSGDVHCGGSIIGPVWVISARHCKDEEVIIIAGTNELSERTANDQIRSVIKFVEHPIYSELADFALFQLNSSLEYNDRVKPVLLPITDQFDLGVFIIMGHGLSQGGTTHSRLQKTTVIVEAANRFELESIAQHSPGSGPCSGDSGGSLVKKNYNGTYTLFGITIKANAECQIESFVSYYSRVTYYVDWVVKTISQTNEDRSKSQ